MKEKKKKATRDATKDWEHFAKRTQWIGQKCLQSVINKHVYKISDILIGCNERMKRKKELLATNEYKRMKCERSRKIYVSQMHLKLITSPSCWFSFTLFSLLKSFKPTNRLKQQKKRSVGGKSTDKISILPFCEWNIDWRLYIATIVFPQKVGWTKIALIKRVNECFT